MSVAKLICVDDEEQILKALKRCLRVEEYELLTTTNPNEAIEWVTAGGVIGVVSDYRMQQMTGVELLKKVQAIDPSVVRIILSGYAEQEAVDQALREGVVVSYLLKPWESEQLRTKLRELLATKQSIK